MRRVLMVVAAAVALVSSSGSAAVASCPAPPPLKVALRKAPDAFVGRVVETSNDDRWVVVEVSEVWKGEAEAVVEVRGGPKDPPGPLNAASSVDRDYREGGTYLFVPYAGNGEVFRDNACTPTTEFDARVEELRPPEASAPAAGEAPPPARDERPTALWWGAGAAAAIAAAALLGWMLRR